MTHDWLLCACDLELCAHSQYSPGGRGQPSLRVLAPCQRSASTDRRRVSCRACALGKSQTSDLILFPARRVVGERFWLLSSLLAARGGDALTHHIYALYVLSLQFALAPSGASPVTNSSSGTAVTQLYLQDQVFPSTVWGQRSHPQSRCDLPTSSGPAFSPRPSGRLSPCSGRFKICCRPQKLSDLTFDCRQTFTHSLPGDLRALFIHTQQLHTRW